MVKGNPSPQLTGESVYPFTILLFTIYLSWYWQLFEAVNAGLAPAAVRFLRGRGGVS
jgi:hypothetical protein